MSVDYTTNLEKADLENLEGFFVGWPNPPTKATLAALLKNSDHILLAREDDKVVGYVTALSDGVLFSYISSIEVLPEYQGRRIGKELLDRMLAILSDHYATDLVCDEDVVPFYERAGMIRLSGMGLRRRERLTPS